jgi:exopolyphosphatase/guanosine-5'-triphosphate,3'-diphosphate pyrophosphatase
MAKITTVIDIGSNSMRMVVFEKSSRFGFHLINETKSRVKISEGCYENGGNLQPIPMQRAFDALRSFLQISKTLKSTKVLCVATSALRDAPNQKEFLSLVNAEFGLKIKIIEGIKEAYYGGIAAVNLLDCDDFISIDIGGGSTELCLAKTNDIRETVSLNIGTVRLKELYFDKGDIKGAKALIMSELEKLVNFKSSKITNLVGIGGTARALSRSIIKKDRYPFDVLHGFEYDLEKNISLFDKIIEAKSTSTYEDCNIKSDRFDTIKEGTFIFKTICEFFKIQKVVTSGVGVREGVYLCDLLRTQNNKFPSNYNPSIRSLLDRFDINEKTTSFLGVNAGTIFESFKPLHNLDDKYKKELVIASKLLMIGVSLNFYKHSYHAFNFILNGLDYGFSHSRRVLIAHIIKYSKKNLPKFSDLIEYDMLLPDVRTVQWLSFMTSLNIAIAQDSFLEKCSFEVDDEIVRIFTKNNHYLAKNSVSSLTKPKKFEIEFVEIN